MENRQYRRPGPISMHGFGPAKGSFTHKELGGAVADAALDLGIKLNDKPLDPKTNDEGEFSTYLDNALRQVCGQPAKKK